MLGAHLLHAPCHVPWLRGRGGTRCAVQPRMSRVLVVDDDPELLSVLMEVFESEGYQVDHAINGQEALERVTEHRPDAIVTDLIMPVIDGWRFLEQCRALPNCQQVPVLVISAFAHGQDVQEKMHQLGVEALVTKPFDLEEVVARVRARVPPSPRRTAA